MRHLFENLNTAQALLDQVVVGRRDIRYPPLDAEYARVCRDTIYTACERGELRHTRIGGRRAIRLKREWIDEWFERHTRQARDWSAAGLSG